MEKCIGCELCAGVCPARCIYVRGADNPIDDPVSPGERYGFVYEINYLRCIHCDLCVEACPTEAITETKLFEFSFTNRADAIYTKDQLLVDDDGRARRHAVGAVARRRGRPHERVDARDRRRPASRAYEGRVSWSGELGFGVRPPEHGQRDPRRRRPRSRRTTSGRPSSSSSAPPRSSPARSASSLGRNPVHSALFLLLTLVSVAVLFLQQHAALVAAIQIVVYASAIVVLFLFVITLLGVDKHEAVRRRRTRSSGSAAIVLGVLVARRDPRARARQPLGDRRALDARRARHRRDSGNVRDARDEPVHRLRLGVRDHRGAARDRGRRQRRARPPQRPPRPTRPMPRPSRPSGRARGRGVIALADPITSRPPTT